MTTDAINSQSSPDISPTGSVGPLPQTKAPIPAHYVTYPPTNSNLRPSEKEPPACSPKPVPPERKLPTCSPKRVFTAGLLGIAGSGCIFGMLASCTILGGVAGVILGLVAWGAANLLLKLAMIMLIGAFKEPNNPNYTIDSLNEITALSMNLIKHPPILCTLHGLTQFSLITATFISLMALGGTQGIILDLVLATTYFSLELLLNFLLNQYPALFHHQQQFS